ncbi:MAG: GH1 family beta-glucosidase [bacterium]|nr:GH1 family beta-glucosidase [bacterium]
MAFPSDFYWGAATSSYQVEGDRPEDGRGECIWRRFSHTPGKVKNGDTGDIACDHLHLVKVDIALMKYLNFNAYRFSVSWPRVLPRGTGDVYSKGMDFYDRLVDDLLEENITPFLTLYHWDLPQALQDRGGWENPDSVQWFADYADVVTRRLGDRVQHWATHNEPAVVAYVGNLIGAHAPGKTDPQAAFRVAHHLLLSHGAGMGVIRANAPRVQAGIVLDIIPYHPASSSEADAQAARRYDGFQNRWFLDPIFRGEYPADMVEIFGDALRGLDLEAVKAAAVPIDFMGVNYYRRYVIQSAPGGWLAGQVIDLPGVPVTEMGWEVYPQGLTDSLVRIAREYPTVDLYVTENGAAYEDVVPLDGRLPAVIEDPERSRYIQQHISAIDAAVQQDAPLKGYFAWSFLDNFEWGEGYSKRFGLVYVDFPTQRRVFKRSALDYREWILRQRQPARAL